MIVFAQATEPRRIPQTMECLRRVNAFGNFDRKVIVVNETETEKLHELQKEELLDQGAEIYLRDWNDDMPGMRNAYLDKCQNGDWIVVSDSDEWFNEEFCRDIKDIIENAEQNNFGLLLINSHDSTTMPDGTVNETVSDFMKNLIFKKYPVTHYEGVGKEQKVHEKLILPPNTNIQSLDKKYFYTHIKFMHEIWERATRNVFIGGGGNNVGELNDQWIKLRKITKELDIDSWPAFREFLKNTTEWQWLEKLTFTDSNGKLHPDYIEDAINTKHEIKTSSLFFWILTNRRMGFDWENEMCDVFRWFRYLHPDLVPERIDIITDEIPERAKIMGEVEKAYLEVLGRNADTFGKEAYTKMIELGTATLEQVYTTLQESDEYKQKYPDGAEVIQLEKFHIDVNAHITEKGIRDQIIKKSYIYKTKYANPLRLGRKCEALLVIAKKVESGGSGDDDAPIENFKPFIKTFKKLVPPEKYNHVLNVGAGTGGETQLLQEAGYNPIGITFGRDNIEIAKERYFVRLYEMDMHNLRFPEGIFDAVLSIQTFEHAFAPWLHILELRRVLKEWGRVFIDVPDPDDQEMLETIWHTSVLYPNQIKALFKKAGFREVTDLSIKHRLAFCFEKLPDGHEEFKLWSYVKYIMEELGKID